MQIEVVKREKYEEIKHIWAEVFEDSEDYINKFFEDFEGEFECLAAFDGAKPVSMLFLLPVYLSAGSALYSMEYIYAVATLKEYRGQGNASVLLRFAELHAKDRGFDAVCLQPADMGLSFFYGKMGYKPCFSYDAPIENNVIYSEKYINHVKKLAASEGEPYPITRENFDRNLPKGMIKRLNDSIPEDIAAFMPYIME